MLSGNHYAGFLKAIPTNGPMATKAGMVRFPKHNMALIVLDPKLSK